MLTSHERIAVGEVAVIKIVITGKESEAERESCKCKFPYIIAVSERASSAKRCLVVSLERHLSSYRNEARFAPFVYRFNDKRNRKSSGAAAQTVFTC